MSACLYPEDQKAEMPDMRTRLTQHEVIKVALQVVHFPLRKLAVMREHVHMSPSARRESMLGKLHPKRQLSDIRHVRANIT